MTSVPDKTPSYAARTLREFTSYLEGVGGLTPRSPVTMLTGLGVEGTVFQVVLKTVSHRYRITVTVDESESLSTPDRTLRLYGRRGDDAERLYRWSKFSRAGWYRMLSAIVAYELNAAMSESST